MSAYTLQNSWEWNDTFTIGDNLVKQVNGVSSVDILNVGVINLKDEKEVALLVLLIAIIL